jgi:hypothetical protein
MKKQDDEIEKRIQLSAGEAVLSRKLGYGKIRKILTLAILCIGVQEAHAVTVLELVPDGHFSRKEYSGQGFQNSNERKGYCSELGLETMFTTPIYEGGKVNWDLRECFRRIDVPNSEEFSNQKTESAEMKSVIQSMGSELARIAKETAPNVIEMRVHKAINDKLRL